MLDRVLNFVKTKTFVKLLAFAIFSVITILTAAYIQANNYLPDWLQAFNNVAWVGSNALVAYIVVALVVFVLGYYLLFNPRATTGGKLIFRFAFSLIGVMALVFISIYINPREGSAWTDYPGDVFWWRPGLRLFFYAYVAYNITSLTKFVAIRKWRPDLLKTSIDKELLTPRKFD